MTNKLPEIIKREWDTYDLSSDALLDKHHLEDAAEIQSSLMNKWLDLLEQAERILSKAERNLKFVESQLLIEAKTGALKSIVKEKSPTDILCKAWVYTQPKYLVAQKEVDNARDDVKGLTNSKWVMESKQRMIQIEANLWQSGYFSRSQVPKKMQVAVDKAVNESQQEEAKEMLQRSMKKRETQ